MAGRFTLILWGLITLPLLIVGFIALVASGAKMGEIHREAQAEMRARQDELTRSLVELLRCSVRHGVNNVIYADADR